MRLRYTTHSDLPQLPCPYSTFPVFLQLGTGKWSPCSACVGGLPTLSPSIVELHLGVKPRGPWPWSIDGWMDGWMDGPVCVVWRVACEEVMDAQCPAPRPDPTQEEPREDDNDDDELLS